MRVYVHNDATRHKRHGLVVRPSIPRGHCACAGGETQGFPALGQRVEMADWLQVVTDVTPNQIIDVICVYTVYISSSVISVTHRLVSGPSQYGSRESRGRVSCAQVRGHAFRGFAQTASWCRHIHRRCRSTLSTKQIASLLAPTLLDRGGHLALAR